MGPKPMSHTQSASLMTALGTQDGSGEGEGEMELVTEREAVRLRETVGVGVREDVTLRVVEGEAEGPATHVAVPLVVLADRMMFLLPSHTHVPRLTLKMPPMSGASRYAPHGTQAAISVLFPAANTGAYRQSRASPCRRGGSRWADERC